VFGHQRRRYFVKSNVHKRLCITRYLKGPADKPLKAPAGNVFAVTH
jgi:hypothetical protein